MRNNKYSPWKILDQPEKLAALRAGRLTPPLYLRIKPTNRCCHRCRWCVYHPEVSGMHGGFHPQDELPAGKLFEILEDLQAMGVQAVTYSGGGEPLCHPAITEILQRTLNHGLKLSILTNGQLLYGEAAQILGWARWVRVSMDYGSPEGFSSSRQVPGRLFDEVLNNLRAFVRSKRPDCELAVNFIIHRENHQELFAIARTLKDIGVESLRFSPVWVPNFQAYHAPLAERVRQELAQVHPLADAHFEVYSTYDLSSESKALERGYDRCYYQQCVTVIGADQSVYVCHHKAYDPSGAVGSLRGRRFRDLWSDPRTLQFFNGFNPREHCRHECANDFKNVIIHGGVEAHPDPFL